MGLDFAASGKMLLFTLFLTTLCNCGAQMKPLLRIRVIFAIESETRYWKWPKDWEPIPIECHNTIASATAMVDVGDWLDVETGIKYKDVGYGRNILITFAAPIVSQHAAHAWTDRLVTHSELRLLGVGHLYASVEYSNDSKNHFKNLTSHILNQNPAFIVIVAHSKSTYSASDFLRQLYAKGANSNKTDKKIVYYNLDGYDRPGQLVESKLKNIYFVYAKRDNLYSRNSDIMHDLAFNNDLLEMDGDRSSCLTPACLHDVMIIRMPWNSHEAASERDYSVFRIGDREVQFDYITKTKSVLQTLNQWI